MAASGVGSTRTAPRKSWLIWSVGSGVYLLAVFHRSSLGVAGPLAAQRLSLTGSQLAGFVMLQLAVYAAMQVPTGILVDRYGPRRMLLAATLAQGAAQICFAFVQGYLPALLARGLLGCGDAMTYVSVLRLVAGWFPARRYAVLASFTALVGAAGNLLATLPLTGLLHLLGWGKTFAIAGALSLVYALLLLRPSTAAPFHAAQDRAATGPVSGRRVLAEVRSAWRMPAGRLGFWVHFTTMAAPATFAVLWGFPYLTEGLQYSAGLASSIMLELVLGGVVANVVIGQVVSRKPEVRTPLAIGVVLACLVAWTVLITWPGGHPPLGVVMVVIAVLSVGGPASSVAFLLARDYNPRHRISTATGMVNVGGFCGAVIGIFAVGRILDWTAGPGAQRTADDFRLAFCALIVLTAAGLARLVTWWLRTRALVLLAEARGEDVPVHLHLHRWELVDQAQLEQEAALSRAAPDAGLPPDGGILLVDKPAGCTSHDVVGRVRYLLGTRRVGHAGTLDPMATGLLVIGVERSTRLLGHLALATKSYRATIRLGQTTATDDAEGEVVSTALVDVADADIVAGIAALTGDLWQRPSSVSAIKVDGRRAYDRVRAGEEVELAARPVTVTRFTLDAPPRRSDGFVDLDVTVDCSTGTYIRALARDLGAALGVGGHLRALRRTAVGPFQGPARRMSTGREAVPRGHQERTPPPDALVVQVRAALRTPLSIARAVFPIREIADDLAVDVRFGRPIPADGRPGVIAVVAADRLLALMSDRADTARPVLVWSPA